MKQASRVSSSALSQGLIFSMVNLAFRTKWKMLRTCLQHLDSCPALSLSALLHSKTARTRPLKVVTSMLKERSNYGFCCRAKRQDELSLEEFFSFYSACELGKQGVVCITVRWSSRIEVPSPRSTKRVKNGTLKARKNGPSGRRHAPVRFGGWPEARASNVS